MWPHSISVGLGGTAVSIGTDAPEVIGALEPWRVPDVGEPTDYCLELSPPAHGGAGAPRPLPGLYHGATALLRSRDRARLTTALRRVLASHARPAADGEVRIGLMPVVRDGVALLAPPTSIAALPDRWMTAQGIDAIHTVSSLVNVDGAQVLVDPPLGSHEEPAAPALGGWWLPPSYRSGALSPGFAVAEAMALVADVTTANAPSVLEAVAQLVERAHPVHAPRSVAAIKESLARAFEEVASQ